MRHFPEIAGQYNEGDSFIHRIDPRTKIISLLILSGVVFSLDSWLEYLAFGLVTFTLLYLGRIRILRWLNMLRPLAWFLFLLFLMHLGSAGGWQIGLAVLSRFIFLLSLAVLLTDTTPVFSLAMGLQKLLQPLNVLSRLGDSLAFMLTMAIRFIPLTLQENQKIMEAQQARGVCYKPRYLPLLAHSLLVNVMKKADEISRGIEARGFHLGPQRASLYKLRFTNRDVLVFIAVAVFSISIMFHLWSIH